MTDKRGSDDVKGGTDGVREEVSSRDAPHLKKNSLRLKKIANQTQRY